MLRALLRAGFSRLADERGQALPIVAAAMLGLLLTLGLITDGGNGFQNKQDLQNAADATAIAAALEVARGNCTVASTAACSNTAGKYAGMNTANGSTATSNASTPIPVCDPTAGVCTPPYLVYPYVDAQGKSHVDEVEVNLRRTTSPFFGGLFHVADQTEGAIAVAGITSGQPPPFTFVTFDTACDIHTLLIRNSGALRVNQNIYDNSPCGNPHDAFDLFGPGGTITAPDIFTRSPGWEDNTGTQGHTIFLHGEVPPAGNACPYKNSSIAGATTDPRCPEFNQPNYPDPFTVVPTPPLGLPAWGGGGSGVPVGITQINRISGVATAVTASANGFAAGDNISISGIGSGFDGAYKVASVVNATTFTYTNAGTNTPSITQKQLSGGVATLTTNAPFTLTTGQQVTVTGIDNIFNVANLAVTGTTASTFSYTPPPYKLNVTNKQLQGGIATLKVNTNAGLAVGDTASVAGVDPLLNGSFVITALPAGSISYADNVSQQVAVTNRSIAGATTATITTANTHVFATGDVVTVNTGDSRFDSPPNYTAIAGSGTGTLKYTIPAVTATVTNASAAASTIALTASAAPKFETGDTVAVPALGLAYGGGTNVTLTGVNGGAKTFSYAAAQFNTSSWSRAGTTITINTASAHGLKTGNTVTVSGFGGMQACLNKANVAVTAVPTATSFTYTDAACTPPAGGNGKVILVTAASAAASGTATLQATPALGAGGTVTGPASIASTAITCNNCVTLTDVPAAAATGTFTYGSGPAWMPAAGAVLKSLPGSAGNPAQLHPADGDVLSPGTYYGGICIGLPVGTTCNDANCAAALTTQSYSGTAPTLSQAITNTPVTAPFNTFTVTQQKIAAGDVINIGTEDMQVTSVTNNAGGGQTLTVVRGYMTDTAVTSAKGGLANHASGATISKVVSSQPAVSVTLNSGIYIMASGGFYVCANGSVSAPQVLLYNTDDTVSGAEVAKIGQIELFTLRSVTLGPQPAGLYGGLTIFQDHQNEVDTTDSCDKKSMVGSSAWDVALVAAASTGANGSLGSISGSVYATDSTHPGANRTDFGDGLSGTATLAVMTDCIFIDGANSTFNFDTQQGKLFGLSATLTG